ncbi:unnamed protein product [Hermetia illucens]|uniref:CCHC-type domain-containing protein n=1 Tax=Hermetia illucens TaxID=343691 RepID=A0A7R8URM1_HERIL|nr:unnamed protein product [Hermetia illucens]
MCPLEDLLKFVQPFSGKSEDVFNFLNSCTQAMELVTEEQKPVLFRYIQTQIKGDAQLILMKKEFSGWEDLKSELKTVYQEPHSALQLHRELVSSKQGHDETVVSYTQRVQTLQRRILQLRSGRIKKEFQAGEINYLNEETLTVFVNGLRQTLSTYVITQRPKTVEEASRLAQEDEQRLNMFKTNTSRDFSNINRLPKVSHVKSSVKCYSCGKLGHIARNYKSSGHLNQNKSNSDKQNNNNNNNRNQIRTESAKSENVEFNKKNENTSSNFKVNAVNKVLEFRNEMMNSPYIFIKVNGEYIKALIDTGADVSLILKRKGV